MKRIVSVWLPRWKIERLRQHTPAAVPDEAPLALVESRANAIRIVAVNARAEKEGVRIGAPLADARAALPALLSRPAEPRRDWAALLKLARWAGRYGQARNRDGEDGLWIDISGVAHLFGGEEKLIADFSARLACFRLTARLGLAGTLGAAHALARFGSPGGTPWAIAPEGETCSPLAHLPVEALRLAPESVLLLQRLGLRRIGQLYDLPRAALERRFRSETASKSRAKPSAAIAGAVLARLDQALGVSAEPLRGLAEPPVLAARRLWAEPLLFSEPLEAEVASLAHDLCKSLADQALGARRIRLSLYRTDGSVAEIAAGLSRASRAPAHLIGLLKEKLSEIDAGFGIDAAVLEALAVDRLGTAQAALGAELSHTACDASAALTDRLLNRLGPARVFSLVPHASHIPERSERRAPPLDPGLDVVYEPPWPYARGPRRPPFLLEVPEIITVMAEVPEGPPARFVWRRVATRVVRAQGPERIAPEWWREIAKHADKGDSRPRDYYTIEDDCGARYWVFREGLYQHAAEEGPPRWFLHGLFG